MLIALIFLAFRSLGAINPHGPEAVLEKAKLIAGLASRGLRLPRVIHNAREGFRAFKQIGSLHALNMRDLCGYPKGNIHPFSVYNQGLMNSQSKVATISGDDLEKLTGFTDRRHRQLAKEGWFPAPSGGKYETVKTLQGLFKYLRESKSADQKTRADKLHEEWRWRKLLNDAKERKLVSRHDVEDSFARFAEASKGLLRQKLENEYPAAVAGADIPTARARGKELTDLILRGLMALVTEWSI